jgi:hypothetical protein
MRDKQTTLILAATASILVLSVVVGIVINPLVAIGLAPILGAIAVIIRAIAGTGR